MGATEIFNTVYFLDRQIERLEAEGYRINEEAEQRLTVELLKLAPAKITNKARGAVSKGLILTQPFGVAFLVL
jgi:predicted PurR-regulated permease PerM